MSTVLGARRVVCSVCGLQTRVKKKVGQGQNWSYFRWHVNRTSTHLPCTKSLQSAP